MKPACWTLSFPCSEVLAKRVRSLLPAAAKVFPGPHGAVMVPAEAWPALRELRALLRDEGVPFIEQSGLGAERADELGDARLISLEKPRTASVYVSAPASPYPLRERRCERCGVEGFCELEPGALTLQLDRAPEDGIVHVAHYGGMNSLPEPTGFYAMSAALRDAMERAGLLTGLRFFDLVIKRRPKAKYFGLLPTARLQSMVAPFGHNPAMRSCEVCGFINARYSLYPAYPRPDVEADWYLAAPWSAARVFLSQRVFAWLITKGLPLYAPSGLKQTRFFRAGFAPDEEARAFLPAAFRE